MVRDIVLSRITIINPYTETCATSGTSTTVNYTEMLLLLVLVIFRNSITLFGYLKANNLHTFRLIVVYIIVYMII